MAAQTNTQGWHTASWGLWGWLETAVKLVGIIFGFVALTQITSTGTFTLNGHPHLAAVIVLGLLTLFAVGTIAIRIQQREIISVAFAVINALGHLAVLIALLWEPTTTTLPLLFGIAYIIGGLIKIRFLSISGYTESGLSSRMILNFTWGVIAFYAIYSVLLVI